MKKTLIVLASMLSFAAFGKAESSSIKWTGPAPSSLDSLNLNLNRSLHDQWFSQDKAHHFMVSAFLTGFTYYAVRQELNQSRETAAVASVSISFSIGIAKEIYDGVSGRGTPSFKDIVADAAGVAVGIIMSSVSSQ